MTLPPGIVAATQDHVAELAANMAPADAEEVWAASMQTPQRAVELCFLKSEEKHTWIVDGEVMCMWGVGHYSALSIEATPWMLGTEKLRKHARAFARGSKIIAAGWKQRYPILRNYVDARHTLAVRWVEWIGFKLLPAEPYGPFGVPFHPFEATPWEP